MMAIVETVVRNARRVLIFMSAAPEYLTCNDGAVYTPLGPETKKEKGLNKAK